MNVIKKKLLTALILISVFIVIIVSVVIINNNIATRNLVDQIQKNNTETEENNGVIKIGI